MLQCCPTLHGVKFRKAATNMATTGEPQILVLISCLFAVSSVEEA
jgi:hypothetical protein